MTSPPIPTAGLSDAEFARLEAYAKAQGMTVEDAATHLARQQLALKFRNKSLAPAQVLQMGVMRRAERPVELIRNALPMSESL